MKKTLPYLKHVCVLLLLVLITELTTAQVPDSSFGANGVQTLTPHSDIVYFSSAAFESNKIVIGLYEADEGYFRSIDLFRLTQNGALDSSFGPSGLKQRYDLEGGYISVQKDNKIVVLGTGFDDFEEPPFPIHVYRYKHNGQYDSTFGTNGDFSVTLEKSNEGRQIAIQKNGNIVIGGDLQTPSKQTVALIQITPDGKLDSSFGNKWTASANFSANTHMYCIKNFA